MQQITAALAPKVKELDAINQRIGAVPTVEQSLQEQGYVVDDYGRLVKPDGKEATDEEYGRYFKELDKKRETEALLAKLKSENKAQITEENQHRYVGPLVTSMKANMVQRMLDNYGLLAAGIKEDATVRDLKDQISTLSDPQNLAQMQVAKREEQAATVAALQQKFNALTQQLNSISPADVVTRGELRDEIDSVKAQLTEAVNSPQVQRQTQLQQIQTLQAKLEQAKANAAPSSRHGIENAINSGVINTHVAKALGIEGLNGKVTNASDALPNIEAQISKLEQSRQELTKSSDFLVDDKGTITKDGKQFIANEAKLNELKRLRDIANQQVPVERKRADLTPTLAEGEDWLTGAGQVRPTDEAAQQRLAAREQLSPAESRIQSTIETAARENEQAAGLVPIEQGKSKDWYSSKATEAADTRNNSFDRLSALLEDYRSGAVLGDRGRAAEKGAGPRAGAITKASYTEEGLVNETDKLRQQILNAAIDEVAHQRMANGLRPLTSHEALVMRADINRMLQQFFKQSTALPKNHPQALITRMTQRPQMRGPKVVVPAKYETVDPRSITKLPFQDQRIAAKQVSDVINNKINQYAEQGSREATNLWFKPSTEPHRRATPEQLQHLLDTAQLSKEQRETLENWQIGRAHV